MNYCLTRNGLTLIRSLILLAEIHWSSFHETFQIDNGKNISERGSQGRKAVSAAFFRSIKNNNNRLCFGHFEP